MDVPAHVEGMRRYTIHGESYVVFYFSHDENRETIRHTQLSEDALPDDLRVGDAVTITYIGIVVAGVRRS